MPIMYFAANLARAEFELQQAQRCVKAGTMCNVASFRATRDRWWGLYRAAKGAV
jgi:hypothetical protein